MAKEFYMRTIVAGRYRKVARYTRALPSDSKATRAAKTAATNKAQHYINIKNSTEKLQWLLCANYDAKDACFCTFTCRDDALPPSRQAMKQRFSEYRQKLVREWNRQGRQLKTIYVVEGEALTEEPAAGAVSGLWEIAPWCSKQKWEGLDETAQEEKPEPPTRLHAHCFLLLRKEDYEVVRAFWPWGHVYINRMKVNDLMTFQRLAAYVTKEARAGKLRKGERSYIPSQNLEQPQTGGHWCSEFEGIAVPGEAEKIGSGSEHNDAYGASMEYVFYRMPRPQQPLQSYQSKGRLKKQSGKRKAK